MFSMQTLQVVTVIVYGLLLAADVMITKMASAVGVVENPPYGGTTSVWAKLIVTHVISLVSAWFTLGYGIKAYIGIWLAILMMVVVVYRNYRAYKQKKEK
jgi:hypothetical protein